MTTRRSLAVSWLLAAMFICWSASAGETYEISYAKANVDRWTCRRCLLEERQVRGEVVVGAHHTNDAQARFGRDNGLAEKGTNVLAAIDWEQRFAVGELALQARDLGLNARRVDLSWRGNRGRWSASWREIPRVNFLDGRTAFSAGGDQILPASWVHAFTTTGMSAFDASSRVVGSATERRILELGGEYLFAPRWHWFGRLQFETRRGGRLRGADILYQTVQLIEPVDYETRLLSSGFRWSTTAVDAVGWVDHSTFDSGSSGVRYENPFTSFFASGGVSSPSSTQSERIGLSMRLTPSRSVRVSARFVWAEESQDDVIGSPVLVGQPLVLGLRADRFDGRLRGVVRIGQRLRVISAFSVRERDIDEGAGMAPSWGRWFETKDSEARFQWRYRASSTVRLEGGVSEARARRPGQEQARFDETGVWMKIALNLGAIHFVVGSEFDDRDAAEFVRNTNNHPDTRRFHLADRERERRRARLSYDAGTIGFSIYHDAIDNDFSGSALGLREHESRVSGLEIDWDGEVLGRIAAYVSVDELRSLTFGTSDFVNRDWHSQTDDEVTTWGLNWRLAGVGGTPLDATLELTSSDGVADYTTTWLGAASPLPRLVADQKSLSLDLTYTLTPRSRIFVRVFHERFNSADWALDNVTYDTLPTLLGLGLSSPDYSATSVAIGFRRTW